MKAARLGIPYLRAHAPAVDLVLADTAFHSLKSAHVACTSAICFGTSRASWSGTSSGRPGSGSADCRVHCRCS